MILLHDKSRVFWVHEEKTSERGIKWIPVTGHEKRSPWNKLCKDNLSVLKTKNTENTLMKEVCIEEPLAKEFNLHKICLETVLGIDFLN